MMCLPKNDNEGVGYSEKISDKSTDEWLISNSIPNLAFLA